MKIIEIMTCTIVSGYWNVKNKHNDQFNEWFDNTLKINCPYVFFGDNETIEFIKIYRGDLPTYYIELELSEFITDKYRDSMAIHTVHCPSVELNMIWNEKIFLIQRAARINPFDSDFFMWVDAGICTYRKHAPPINRFPEPAKLVQLPKDKFICSTSDHPIFQEERVKRNEYYHYISGTYILHRSLVDSFCELYLSYLDKINKDNIWTDQVILTHMYKEHSELFCNLCHGYGAILLALK